MTIPMSTLLQPFLKFNPFPVFVNSETPKQSEKEERKKERNQPINNNRTLLQLQRILNIHEPETRLHRIENVRLHAIGQRKL
jgi:hypothetical protein